MAVEVDPTLTPELNPWFSIAFLVLTSAWVAVELFGVWRKDTGDTFTEHWRWMNEWLPAWAAWLFRIFTGGLLIWTVLHFLGGVD